MTDIPVISSHKARIGEDPAAIIPLARLTFAPPRIRSASNEFVWPMGVEGFRRYGSATLGIHKYLGAANVSVQVAHLDEAHIEMSGTFPGINAKTFMNQLLAVLTADGSKDLILPGVFTRIQRVFTENYDFDHGKEERTHSIDYVISFVRTTVGATVSTTQKQVVLSSTSSTVPGSPRNTSAVTLGQSDRIFTAVESVRTLREISAIVYGDQDEWQKLVELNRSVLDIYNPNLSASLFQLPTIRLPVGTKIAY